MHHKKRTARLLLCVLALAMALSACGKKGGAFQGPSHRSPAPR